MNPTTPDLFADAEPVQQPRREQIGEQSYVLRGFALPGWNVCCRHSRLCWLRHRFGRWSRRGFTMSVALSSCGALGWTTDRSGYRYTHHDPQTGQPWPDMPEIFLQLAQAAAQEAGFSEFLPDSCLINRYLPGAKMSLHQDKNECTYAAPIVSVSLGLPAMFLFGGFERGDKASVSRCCTATSWSGAASIACAITVSCPSRKASIHCWVNSGSTSPSARRDEPVEFDRKHRSVTARRRG